MLFDDLARDLARRRMSNVCLLLIFTLLLIPYVTAIWDPYEILGVGRNANHDQIKRAYRNLARKLHPDKSNLSEDESGRRFIELNKAFSILKDPARRNRYDQEGEIEEGRHSPGRQARRGSYNHNGYKSFTFFSSASSNGQLRRRSITIKQYNSEYLKESNSRPFMIFFYTDFCPSCSLIESAWIKITDELAKYNIGSFTIDAHRESPLSRDLGVDTIPHIACLMNGVVMPYYQSELSLSSIVRFIRSLLPDNLITKLESESDQDRFIALSPEKNRLTAIIIQNEVDVKLRHLILAFEMRNHYRFGLISTKTSSYKLFAENHNLSINVNSRQPHLLVFDEDIKRPLIKINLGEDVTEFAQLRKVLLKWPHLQLPRLNSQQKFDELCLYKIPREADRTSTRLCIILFATNTPSSSLVRVKMMEFIKLNGFYRDDSVVFAYLDPTRQKEFVSSLLLETNGTYPFRIDDPIDSAVLTVVRHQVDGRKALYSWIESRWDPMKVDAIDRAKNELYQKIKQFKSNVLTMHNKVALRPLTDEEGPGLLDRVFRRLIENIQRTINYITSRESFATVVILLMCALVASLFLYQTPERYPAQSETDRAQSKTGFDRVSPVPHREASAEELKILELKAETYNGMLRLLKPGHRSIVLLCDLATKDRLLPKFKKAVWPYRRNKTLLFGYLCLDKNLEWYKALLQEVLDVEELVINKKNCIGTVLSLNGFKKYFRVYHIKHHEIDYYDNETDNSGSFLGFGDEEVNIEIGKPQISNIDMPLDSVEFLLDKLPIWLDKMFDGLTKRYFVDKWPEVIN